MALIYYKPIFGKPMLAVLALCLLPSLLGLFGVDFGAHTGRPDASSNLLKADQLHYALQGSIIHTVLEWSATCAALFTVILAFVHYRVKRDPVILVIGLALFCAGCMDAFHTLTATRLIGGYASSNSLIPFTWAICRLFNVLIMIAGSIVVLSSKKGETRQENPLYLILGCVFSFGACMSAVIYYCSTETNLPNTLFPGSVITRPWDIAPLILFLFAGAVLYPRLYHRYPNCFTHALVLGVLLDITVQCHMAFGSTQLFDHHFIIAHGLKVIAYIIPFAGLCMEYVRIYKESQQMLHAVEVSRNDLQREVVFRKQTESALREAEEHTRTALNEVKNQKFALDQHSIVAITTVSGKIVYTNDKFCEISKYSREELFGQDHRILNSGYHSKSFIKKIWSTITSGKVWKGDIKNKAKDGSFYWVSSTIVPIYNEAGQIAQFVAIRTDITKRKANDFELAEKSSRLELANEELNIINAELDEFTYVASHDLQEPLRKLVAFSEILSTDLGDNLSEQVEKDLGFITCSAIRMQMLINDLLELSRADRADWMPLVSDLNECADRAIEALVTRVEESGAIFSRDKLPTLCVDPTLITQLYQNLIGNALKFVRETSPKIHLSYSIDNNVPVLGVKDNGIGIDSKYAKHIFTPFKRLHGRAQYEGSGIGLSICRKTVERHGGRIWVRSETGRGAHFKFTLPSVGDVVCVED